MSYRFNPNRGADADTASLKGVREYLEVTPTERENALSDALKAVCGDRDKQYGTPEDNFRRIAGLWTMYLGKGIEPKDVANMMILLKVARTQSGVQQRDSWVDIAGYAACGVEVDHG